MMYIVIVVSRNGVNGRTNGAAESENGLVAGLKSAMREIAKQKDNVWTVG
jgi:hypothetical protein